MNISSESKDRIIETIMWVILAMFLIGMLYRNLIFYPQREYQKVILYNKQLEKGIKKQETFSENVISKQLDAMKKLKADSKKHFFSCFNEKKSSLYYINEINKLIKKSKLDIEIRGVNAKSEEVNIEDCDLYGLKYTFKCKGDYMGLKKFIDSLYKTFNPLNLIDLYIKSKEEGFVNASFSIKIFYFIREKTQ
ncbi:hypothetical protein KAJ27_22685 [bacterium]|nr:hypothetical protein [bacterium]